MLLFAAILLLVAYVAIQIALTARDSKSARDYFRKNASNIPLLPGDKLFWGHLKFITHDKNWRIIGDLHKKYGQSFGYFMCRKFWVSTTDLDLLKFVLQDEGTKHLDRSDFAAPYEELTCSILKCKKEDWFRSRRVISPALTNHKVRSAEISDDIDMVIRKFKKSLDWRLQNSKETSESGHKSVVLDVKNILSRFVLANFLQIAYKQENIVDFYADSDRMIEMMDKVEEENSACSMIHLGMAYPFINPIVSFFVRFSKIGRMQSQLLSYLWKAIKENEAARKRHQRMQKKLGLEGQEEFASVQSQDSFKRRLMDSFIDAYLEKRINYMDLKSNLLFVTLAGAESISTEASFLMLQLCNSPQVQEKLRKTFLEEGIDAEYAHWCVLETVRYLPAAPLDCGRVLSEDVEVNGRRYPKGTHIMPSTYTIHHDPNIWPDPDKFIPERWRNKDKFHPAAFMGLGIGPRACPGAYLAYYEMKVLFHMILSNYRIERCDNTPDSYEFSSPVMFHAILDRPIHVRLVALKEELGD